MWVANFMQLNNLHSSKRPGQIGHHYRKLVLNACKGLKGALFKAELGSISNTDEVAVLYRYLQRSYIKNYTGHATLKRITDKGKTVLAVF